MPVLPRVFPQMPPEVSGSDWISPVELTGIISFCRTVDSLAVPSGPELALNPVRPLRSAPRRRCRSSRFDSTQSTQSICCCGTCGFVICSRGPPQLIPHFPHSGRHTHVKCRSTDRRNHSAEAC
jgi:hypothetical protein